MVGRMNAVELGSSFKVLRGRKMEKKKVQMFPETPKLDDHQLMNLLCPSFAPWPSTISGFMQRDTVHAALFFGPPETSDSMRRALGAMV